MITNKHITYYHKTLDDTTKLEKWNRIPFMNVWAYGGQGSTINSGYQDKNNISIRIPFEGNIDRNMFAIGDIIAIGLQIDITKQSDLKGIEFYNVTSININDFGNNPHVHLEGK